MSPEQSLSERCKRAERLAFKELYDAYAGRLLSLCSRYVGTGAAAEDILQDSFIKIIQSFGSFRYRGPGSLYAWMSRITVNRALDAVKQDCRIQTVPIDVRETDVGIEDNDIGAVPQEELLRMIRELPPGYRTVFNMFALDGYSHKEIGRALGIKERSSSSQYMRARALLAEKIKDYLNRND